MRTRILFTGLVLAFFVLLSGCGNTRNCPVCGTTTAGGYAVIDVIAVPEHNNTGEPGGPFNSFDISWVDPVNHLDYVSDRIGIAVQVINTNNDVAVNSIGGANSVSAAGNNASPCVAVGADPVPPPIVSVLGNWTRFGCRTGAFHIPGFGSNGLFGGFTGAQCCAARANGINPLSGPDGIVVTPDGKTMYVANASSSVVVFDLTTMDLSANPPVPPNVIAAFPTGLSPDFDGEVGNSFDPAFPNTTGISGCAASANGRAFSDPSCGDLRADEMSYDPTDQILAVANGDPGLPFITLVDMSGINARTSNCQPVIPGTPYGPPLGNALGPINVPSCIIGEIYYDGAGGGASGGLGLDPGVQVDTVGGTFPCPDPSNPQVNSGVSGAPPYIAGTASIPCHHGPILTTAGAFCDQLTPGAGCNGALSLAGIGGSAFNPNTGHFLFTNANATTSLNVGTVDEVDPRLGNPNGPIVINSFLMPNCMPTSIAQGPGNNFLVGCADHDGITFPFNEYVIDGTSGAIKATINNVGGVDEVWYNPGDNRYYLAARDMLPGPVMGVIDAKSNLWLQNVPVNTNAHSISVDPGNNHVFMPQQAGAICGTIAGAGCIDVISEQ
jgi:hypothetical protein